MMKGVCSLSAELKFDDQVAAFDLLQLGSDRKPYG